MLGGCSGMPSVVPPAEQRSSSAAEDKSADLTDRVWVSTDASAAPGTLRIFVSDGTLVMDSCFETYRLAAWRHAGDRRIAWHEDTAAITADIVELTTDRLELRLQLAGDSKTERYSAAATPYACPDVQR
jgi:hypothetical protein